jgi:hypothetical protein
MKTLVTLFAAALFTTAAVADDSNRGHDSMKSADAKFDKLDRNDDGNLSKSEAREEDKLSAQFASVDQNSDGQLSKSEYTARLENSDREDESWTDRDER